MTEPIDGPRSGYIYVASPFSHWNPSVRLERRLRAQAFVKWLIADLGKPAFSPVTYGWDLSSSFRLPEGYEFWEPLNMAMLSSAASLAVLALDGWRESKGVTAELRFAKDLGLPVEFYRWLRFEEFEQMPASIMEAA